MKILLYSMNFSPELAGIGKYSGEMATWFHEQGHEVRVIAAPPSFPHWSVFSGHSPWAYRKTVTNGITIYRTPTWVPAKPRAIARMVHLASFMISSLPVLLAQTRWRPDLIFVVEPPLFCAPGVLAYSKAMNIKSWLHIQDYEVDAAFELGLLASARAKRVAYSIERWLLNRFSRVSTISAQMVDLALKKGAAAGRLVLCPNWVDIGSIYPLQGANRYRQELGIADDAVVVMYSGSMGKKQGLEILGDMARRLGQSPHIHFVFCGNGPTRAALRQECADLPHVHFLDLQPQDRLNELLGLADIHVLPQRSDAADLVMPSKLTGMFASGRAVVVTAHPGTELSNVVKGRGVVVPPGDAEALSTAVFQLANSADMRRTLGAAGRRYAETELQRDTILSRLEGEFQRCLAD
ncbi:glycosyltransferase WbuB [Xylophilus sp. GOD-11R]|uniref:glycosyltransferase WbuB n=1 Tax=Xylophilus sp. GOD-11R TaxID=3089814 RepID=UPI00298CCAF6|nr:glycosyltransferase WbuB [Xylophilus sp. GOD-11R]WPB55489.1 glycosyltransferase WbuB [Xylophilus sp. GOD-11R]